MAKKTNRKYKWLIYGLIAALLAAPNGLMSKYAINSIDPITFSYIRFAAIAILATPLIILNFKKFNPKNLKYAIIGGILLAIASFGYALAINFGQANFVIILMLASPVLLVFYSAKLTKEKINKSAIAGVTLAALGAFIIIFAPLITQGANLTGIPWLSAIFVIGDILAFPLAIVFFKKAYTAGLPIAATIGVSSWISAVIYGLLYVIYPGTETISNIDAKVLLATIYTGVAVVFVARMLDIISYKKLGSAVLSTLFYLEMFLGILLATLLLNESLTLAMFIGGIIILISVYITEAHKHPHFHHLHIFKRH